jgi:DNA-binding response OmpR family regulator
MSARRMLLVGDDLGELRVLAKELAALDDNAWATAVASLESSPQAIRERWPDLITLHCNGLTTAELRGALHWFCTVARLPVLVLTRPDQLKLRLAALNGSADDDATLPIDAVELRTRAERLVARRHATQRPLGDLALDATTHEVLRDGQRIAVTPAEFRLLARFVASPNELVTVDELVTALGDGAARNTAQVHISSLRRKLEASGPKLIHTVHRRGYVLRPIPTIDIDRRLALVKRREDLVKAREDAVARRIEILNQRERRQHG